MLPQRLRYTDWTGPAPKKNSSEELAYLNYLRFTALGCRAKARADLFEACALLTLDRTASRDAFSDALMRCIDQALGKRALLFRPGTEEVSFDEAWLIQLGKALAQDDEDSACFLLKSRVPHHLRRHVRFLISHIAASFSLL